MSHHSSTALRRHLQKQHGRAARWLPAVQACSMTTAWEALPGTSLSAVQYSTVRDTTDRVGLSHTGLPLCRTTGRASPCRATGQTQRALHRFSSRSALWELRGSLLLAHRRPFSEYQFSVCLRNIIISKSNKQSFCVGTAHYFPDRCMRDGCRVELQQEMCHLSVLMTERSI